MIKKTLLLIVLLYAHNVRADYIYDPSTGNSYNTFSNGISTSISGSNIYTGSQWHTNIDQFGNQSGIDSAGNSWSYNASTGYYQNNDGTECFGKGALRSCN